MMHPNIRVESPVVQYAYPRDGSYVRTTILIGNSPGAWNYNEYSSHTPSNSSFQLKQPQYNTYSGWSEEANQPHTTLEESYVRGGYPTGYNYETQAVGNGGVYDTRLMGYGDASWSSSVGASPLMIHQGLVAQSESNALDFGTTPPLMEHYETKPLIFSYNHGSISLSGGSPLSSPSPSPSPVQIQIPLAPLTPSYTLTSSATGHSSSAEGTRPPRTYLSRKTPKICSHCQATSTPLWRRMPGTRTPLCNACGLYLQQRNKLRPQVLIDADADLDLNDAPFDPEAPECSHCHTRYTSVWRRNKSGEPVCNACGVYSRLRGRDRPLELRKNRIRPRTKHTAKHSNHK